MKTASTRRPARGGFTMIEVLVSMVIFTTAFVMLVDAYVNALEAYTGRPQKTLVDQDLAFVRQRLFRAPNRDFLDRGGTIETWEAGSATWSVDYEETEVLDLFRVELEIELDETDEIYTQTLYMLRPSWSDPADRETLLNDKTRRLESDRARLEWMQQ